LDGINNLWIKKKSQVSPPRPPGSKKYRT
jgi:hypothetical protein